MDVTRVVIALVAAAVFLVSVLQLLDVTSSTPWPWVAAAVVSVALPCAWLCSRLENRADERARLVQLRRRQDMDERRASDGKGVDLSK